VKKTINTEWIVDLMENELETAHKNDMRIYVRNSVSAMESLESLHLTKTLIKKSESKVPDMGDAVMNRIHSQVMAAVKNTRQESPVVSRNAFAFIPTRLRPALMATAVVCLMVMSGVGLWQYLSPKISIKQMANSETQNTDMFLAISVEVPEAFADSLISDRHEIDFYLDAAAQKVGRLNSEADANEFYDEFVE